MRRSTSLPGGGAPTSRQFSERNGVVSMRRSTPVTSPYTSAAARYAAKASSPSGLRREGGAADNRSSSTTPRYGR